MSSDGTVYIALFQFIAITKSSNEPHLFDGPSSSVFQLSPKRVYTCKISNRFRPITAPKFGAAMQLKFDTDANKS